MPYDIVFARSVLKQFEKIPVATKDKIAAFLPLLKNNPYPRQTKKLKGHYKTYRLRFGDYRLIYEVDVKAKVVYILKCLHRREVYKK